MTADPCTSLSQPSAPLRRRVAQKSLVSRFGRKGLSLGKPPCPRLLEHSFVFLGHAPLTPHPLNSTASPTTLAQQYKQYTISCCCCAFHSKYPKHSTVHPFLTAGPRNYSLYTSVLYRSYQIHSLTPRSTSGDCSSEADPLIIRQQLPSNTSWRSHPSVLAATGARPCSSKRTLIHVLTTKSEPMPLEAR